MKSISSVVILVAAIICSGLLAQSLQSQQNKLAVSRQQVSRAPLAGFHKFVSDVKWMQFIQYCGRLEKVDDSNAAIIDAKLQQLVALDPDFVKAYEMGAMMLSVQAPDMAIALLDRAVNNTAIKANWRLPYLAGFICMRQVKGKDLEKDKVRLLAAQNYFEISLKRGQAEGDYVLGSFMRAKAMLAKSPEMPVQQAELETWYDYYHKQFGDSNNSTARGGAPAGNDLSFVSGPSEMGRGRVVSRIMRLAQSLRNDQSKDEKVMTATRGIMKKLQSDLHFCDKCYHEYGAGDKFCSSCGEKVAAYGACTDCGHVSSTPFCTNCGRKADVAPATALVRSVMAPQPVSATVTAPAADAAKPDAR